MSRSAIGAIRHRLVLEAPLRASDGGGGATVAWLPVAEVWAAIHPATGDESVIAERISGRITHEIYLRHRDDIAPTMRLRKSSRVFEIVAVFDVDERRRRLRCLCREELL